MKKHKFLLMLFALLAFEQTTWAQDLIINSADEWNDFTTNVNSGNSYSGKTVKLNADIIVSEMVGTSSNNFSGTFDSDGHTLTFNKGESDDRFNQDYCAPFRYIDGASIKSLRIAGTIYTSAKHAAVVGSANGNSKITNCRSSITIDSNYDGDGTHAGFIGVLDGGKAKFTNCLFDGMFIITNTTNCAGFVGWARGDAIFSNCLFNPNSNSYNFSNDESYTFSRNPDNVSISCSYYTRTCGTAQGTDASGMTNDQLLAALGIG